MPPICYFTTHPTRNNGGILTPPATQPRQRREHKNNDKEQPATSNCFLQGLRFLYSGRHMAKVETQDVFVIQNQYRSLGDVLKVKDL